MFYEFSLLENDTEKNHPEKIPQAVQPTVPKSNSKSIQFN